MMTKAVSGALLACQPASHPLQVLTDKKDFEALMKKPGKVVVDYMASWWVACVAVSRIEGLLACCSCKSTITKSTCLRHCDIKHLKARPS